MVDYNQQELELPGIDRRKLTVEFSGGDITSDGGCLLLRQVDQNLELMKRIASVIQDIRKQPYVTHRLEALLRQRVFAIALGYEDVNDHITLRNDPALQVAVGKLAPLASSSTLGRLERKANREMALSIHEKMIETFIASFSEPPEELIMDFDATDTEIHGEQAGRFFHGYYGHYCFLPLYVFCNGQVLVAYLREANRDASRHAGAILKVLTARLRQAWPQVRIIFRGDSGFCRRRILSWCERNQVGYIVGLAQNKRLNTLNGASMRLAESLYRQTQQKQRWFQEFLYAAKTWHAERRVIAKAEHTEKGANPRYVLTNLKGKPDWIYDTLYCARGEMENRIKEEQLQLFANRTSCHDWWPNQFRLLLSSLAYILVETIRRTALQGTEMAKAQCQTIRLKLFKIGAVILSNTRRIRFLLSSAYPRQALFFQVTRRLLNNTG
jgi:Transposase DDE domain group 1